MSLSILLVEDEESIADLIEVYLVNEGFSVIKFSDGESTLKALPSLHVDLAILDIMLPKMSGFDILQEIRKTNTYPIIMLTAKDEEVDKITGLTLGADDYVTKPFKPLELIARVKAQLRRANIYSESSFDQVMNKDQIMVRNLVLNKNSHQCFLKEEEVKLTPIEFSILWELASKSGDVVSSEELFKTVWNEKYYTSANNTVMVHIRHIREKLVLVSPTEEYVKTVWGVGYKIV